MCATQLTSSGGVAPGLRRGRLERSARPAASGSIIELLTARLDAETAGVNYINAVYDYHKAIAALEQAVGRPLR